MAQPPAPRPITVLVVFTHGVGLKDWRDAGILDREVAYYRQLGEAAGSVRFLTYDRAGKPLDDLARLAAPIEVSSNDTRLPYQLFGLLAPLRHYRAFRRADLIRTNQFSGAWVGLLGKWLARRPLVVRGGFIRSQHQTGISLRSAAARFLERLSLRSADAVIVATHDQRSYIAERYSVAPDRIAVIPNPIDIDRFAPSDDASETPGLALAVGRLSREKNLESVIAAVKSLDSARLRIIGRGDLEPELRRIAGDDPSVEFTGAIPNADIPGHIRQAQVFVLASHYEGSPKALLEAMACGKAVIGADSPGIREVIEHEVNGLLVPGTPDAIAAALTRLFSDHTLRRRLGDSAREYVVENNSQAASVALETQLLRKIVERRSPDAV